MSGPGSSLVATGLLRRWLPALLKGMGITSVLDAPCGDGLWMPDLPGYVGVDLVPAVVARAQRRHPERTYIVADVCENKLPQVEAVFSRDGMQHLSLADGLAALRNFRRTGATWLIASTHENGKNVDVETGGYYEPDLEAYPFLLGTPWCVVEDGRWDSGVVYPHKYIGVWTL